MKSVVINKTGGPEVLEIKEIKLEDPKTGEVLIKNEAIGLNYIDTYHRSGLYPVELPSNIGIEGAGVIEKIGPEVKILRLEIGWLMHQCLSFLFNSQDLSNKKIDKSSK